jgi:hypothetical protein
MYLVLMLIVFAMIAPLVLYASPLILYLGPLVLLIIIVSALVASRDDSTHATGR